MKTLILTIMLTTLISAQTKYTDVNQLIQNGEFSKAKNLIEQKLNGENLSYEDILNLQFEKERLERIKIDFNKTADDIIKYLQKYYPDINENDFKKWEDDGSLEFKIIDGKKRYFARAASNLFRLNKDAKKQKELVDGTEKDPLRIFLEGYIPEVLNESANAQDSFVKPVTFSLHYTVTVDANAVPAGEIIKCWLPFPREGHQRQTNVKFLAINSDEYFIASNDNPQRTIYLQKIAIKDQPTIFKLALEVTNYNEVNLILPELVKPYNKESGIYKTFTAERAPHIVFTDKVKNLSEQIVGNEKNPYLIAKKIFTWISENIPWAGAREYSTLDNISDYCITNKHGDCGIKTLLFMTLARYNGIPAKWQSGWMLHPGEVNLHDWCEIYLEGYGWIPVDQSFGLVESKQEDEKYFFLGSIDPYHLIINDDYSSTLYPSKIFPRSETVDFQRGELEWRGGNLYFDKWDYHMDVQNE
ncbi:MAG: transglutaminase-like domain-containing protein [Ignavibacteriaceae bacterium]